MGGDTCILYVDTEQGVSIHAPAWGATKVSEIFTVIKVFQSTPPHGGRLTFRRETVGDSMFQSTPPHGGRPHQGLFKTDRRMFQSTPPHGGRPYRYNMIVVKAFNQCFCELYSKEANILLW